VQGTTGWLLTAAVSGVPSHDPRHRMRSVGPLLETLGRGLRRFHDELPVGECPFDARVDLLLHRAERRVAAGGVDPSTMAVTYRRHTAGELLEHLVETRPAEPAADLVVAHGDPCLPNLLVDPSSNEVTGIVDVGRLGVSDRYRDLAIVARSLVQNFGPDVGYLFFDAYGLSQPDPLRLEFYVLLDDLW
jgi:aminoglycoside phosphotransferase